MDALRKLLVKALEMYDAGQCDHITVTELEQFAALINIPETMGREDAAKFLGLSLNKFHTCRNTFIKGSKVDTIIPSPRKVCGRKELVYYTSDLKKAKLYLAEHEV